MLVSACLSKVSSLSDCRFTLADISSPVSLVWVSGCLLVMSLGRWALLSRSIFGEATSQALNLKGGVVVVVQAESRWIAVLVP